MKRRTPVPDLQVWGVGQVDDLVSLRGHLASLGRIAVPRNDENQPHYSAAPQAVGGGLYRVFVRLYVPKS